MWNVHNRQYEIADQITTISIFILTNLNMGKSKAKEVTPPGTVHVVKWSRKRTTRGIKGQWVSVDRMKPSKSVQSSPTKSSTKQSSDGLMYRFAKDFNGGHEDQGSINPIQLPKGSRKKKRKTLASQSLLTLVNIKLIPLGNDRLQMSIFGSGHLGRRII